MTIPDSVKRVHIYPVPRERVWAALTQPEHFSQWFGTKVQIDLRAGGEFRFIWEEKDDPAAIIEEVSPPHRFAFRWHAMGADHSLPATQTLNTHVEFTLEEVEEGTRLTVVESGFVSLPAEVAERYSRQNHEGWGIALSELEKHLQSEFPAHS